MAVSDWFTDCRDAVAEAVRAALVAAEADGAPAVQTQDVLDPPLVTLPAIVCSFNQVERQVGGTNARDDYAYPIQVTWLAVTPSRSTPDAAADESPPGGLTPFQFRQLLRETFHHRRSVTVAGIDVFLVEYDPEGAVIDEKYLEQYRAGVVVTCYARVPRGTA